MYGVTTDSLGTKIISWDIREAFILIYTSCLKCQIVKRDFKGVFVGLLQTYINFEFVLVKSMYQALPTNLNGWQFLTPYLNSLLCGFWHWQILIVTKVRLQTPSIIWQTIVRLRYGLKSTKIAGYKQTCRPRIYLKDVISKLLSCYNIRTVPW